MSAIVRALSTPKPPFLIKAKRCCRREAGKEEGGEPGRAIAPTQGAGNGGRGAGGDGGRAAPTVRRQSLQDFLGSRLGRGSEGEVKVNSNPRGVAEEPDAGACL